MPRINATITKAWKHVGEPDRIHYTIERAGGAGPRHLYADRGQSLHAVLEDHLESLNYSAPASAATGGSDDGNHG